MKVYVEDISESYEDGFLWLSLIEGMDSYRVQLMESSSKQVGYKALHVYDNEDNELTDEELTEKYTKKAEEWANGKN